MRNIGSLLLYSVLLVVSACSSLQAKEPAPPAGAGLKFAAAFEGGKLYSAGKFKVVELTGDYRQMGRQYGFLLQRELETMYQTIGKLFVEKDKMSPERLMATAKAIFDRYPQRYREILYGISETSGLGLDKVLLVNAVEWLPKLKPLDLGHCSGIAAWGPYTGGGPLVFGRNNDDSPFYLDFANMMVVAVFKPSDNSIPTALIGYAGVIYAATGMNADGLILELNSGPWQGFSLERVSIFTTLFTYLQEYHNVRELDRAMRSTLADLSSIVTVADANRACSYECSLWDTRRRDQDDEGIVAVANAFSLPSWNISLLDPDQDPGRNKLRKDNLLALAARYKGMLTPEVMMHVLNTTIPDGGATHPGTIYQVIAVPQQLKIWLKVPGLQDWTEIPLKPLFDTSS